MLVRILSWPTLLWYEVTGNGMTCCVLFIPFPILFFPPFLPPSSLLPSFQGGFTKRHKHKTDTCEIRLQLCIPDINHKLKQPDTCAVLVISFGCLRFLQGWEPTINFWHRVPNLILGTIGGGWVPSTVCSTKYFVPYREMDTGSSFSTKEELTSWHLIKILCTHQIWDTWRLW